MVIQWLIVFYRRLHISGCCTLPQVFLVWMAVKVPAPCQQIVHLPGTDSMLDE